MRIYDITRTLSESLAVWPDDQPFRVRWTARMAEGAAVNIGSIQMSTHAGTHVDAPLHHDDEGESTDAFDLKTFVGPTLVLDVVGEEAVEVRHVDGLDFDGVPRILFKTGASELPDAEFGIDFTHIDPATVRFLAERSVVLIGTDAPSVDPFDSTDLPSHHELARCGIVNLENLYLRDIEPGLYHLTALPLKVAALDAAPVRAVLMQANETHLGPSH